MPLSFDIHDRRPELVLLHAFPLDRRMWRAQGEALEDRARVLAIDLPGFGASAGVALEPDLDRWADLVEALLAGAVGSRPVVLCGLSMGGYVALRLAARHPGRLRGLVLADTRAAADDEAGRAARDQAIAVVSSAGVPALVESLLPRLFRPTADSQTVALAREIMSGQDRAGVMAAMTAMRDRADSTRVLASVKVPALVVVGADDLLTPVETAERMAAALPRGTLRVIPGAAHLANLEAPGKFNQALLELLEAVAP